MLHLCGALLALASVEGQAIGVGLEGDHAALGEIEDITSNGLEIIPVS